MSRNVVPVFACTDPLLMARKIMSQNSLVMVASFVTCTGICIRRLETTVTSYALSLLIASSKIHKHGLLSLLFNSHPSTHDIPSFLCLRQIVAPELMSRAGVRDYLNTIWAVNCIAHRASPPRRWLRPRQLCRCLTKLRHVYCAVVL